MHSDKQSKAIDQAISHHSFRNLEEIGDLVELTRAPQSTKINLPIQIAFFVYQYAKLRMLQFYRDFMLEHFDRRDFQYVSMDTGQYFKTCIFILSTFSITKSEHASLDLKQFS